MPQNLPIFHCSNFYSFRISGETDDGSSGSKNEKDEENTDSILSHLVSTRYIFLLHANFWTHIGRCSTENFEFYIGGRAAAKAKIYQFDRSLFIDDYIFKLDVSMRDVP